MSRAERVSRASPSGAIIGGARAQADAAKGEPPADAEEFERETGKFEKYFSEKPGRGS